MNRACKVCPHHKYYPKEKPYGIGMHWCVKYNDHISDCHCEQREMMSRKGMAMPQREVKRAYYKTRNNGKTTCEPKRFSHKNDLPTSIKEIYSYKKNENNELPARLLSSDKQQERGTPQEML